MASHGALAVLLDHASHSYGTIRIMLRVVFKYTFRRVLVMFSTQGVLT